MAAGAALAVAADLADDPELSGNAAAAGNATVQAILDFPADLRELGVAKGAGGYRLPGQEPGSGDAGRTLHRSLEREMLAADCAAAMVVLRTQPGHANSLAIEIDRTNWPEIVGTIAGDDAIFVAVRTSDLAGEVAGRLKAMAKYQ